MAHSRSGCIPRAALRARKQIDSFGGGVSYHGNVRIPVIGGSPCETDGGDTEGLSGRSGCSPCSCRTYQESCSKESSLHLSGGWAGLLQLWVDVSVSRDAAASVLLLVVHIRLKKKKNGVSSGEK